MMNIECLSVFSYLVFLLFRFLLCSLVENKKSSSSKVNRLFSWIDLLYLPSYICFLSMRSCSGNSMPFIGCAAFFFFKKKMHIYNPVQLEFWVSSRQLDSGYSWDTIPANNVLRFFCFYFDLFEYFDTSFLGLLVIRHLIALFFCLKQ